LKYMRIPSTAGTRDPERSRFFTNSQRTRVRRTGRKPLFGVPPYGWRPKGVRAADRPLGIGLANATLPIGMATATLELESA
jgi:hypothetical protein